MPPVDGLTQAMEDASFWTAVVGAVGGALTALGARGAGSRLQAWARERNGGNGGEVLKALRGIERAVREEGRDTRKALHETSSADERRLIEAERRIVEAVREGRR